MDLFEVLIYVVLFIFFIVTRILKGARKTGDEPGPDWEPWNRPQKEAEQQYQPQPKPQPAAARGIPRRQHDVKQKKVAVKKVAAPALTKNYSESYLDRPEMEEGVSALRAEMKKMYELPEQSSEETRFQFDPREAFLMKMLLDRPYK